MGMHVYDAESNHRRMFLRSSTVGAASLLFGARSTAAFAPSVNSARIAITLDLEMARNFPRWEETEWDYQKGNLTPEVKQYAVDVGKRVKERGGVVHYFVVGQVLEQSDVAWLKGLAEEGHSIGNHTYDHIYLLARDVASLQYRFARSPWLTRGRPVSELIRENIAMTNEAMKTRLGVNAAGFRTPGGFANGLAGREDLQQMLIDLGFHWVSSKYPAHAGIADLHRTGERPSSDALAAIIAAQTEAQPFVYPTGLVEIPMSPISDIVAFRTGRWKLDDFIEVTRQSLESVLAKGQVFDFLAHPSCLGVVDPGFKTIDMICDVVDQVRDRAKIVSLDAIAEGVENRS